MQIIVFDDNTRLKLLPFTHTRPVADIRCGIMTMRERWEYFLKQKTATVTEPYLQQVFPSAYSDDNLYINGHVFASEALTKAVSSLSKGQKLVKDSLLIAMRSDRAIVYEAINSTAQNLQEQSYKGELRYLTNIWDIFSENDKTIREDFALLTKGRQSQPIPKDIIVTGAEHLFIEEGANIYAGCIINASTGPVYIGKDTEVLEGSLMRGPIATGEHAVIKMGAKLYGATTIGSGCKVGGEINNVVFFANSNKAHDGYLGNAVIGEWCNLGADTNCSNLKNNYEQVKIWDEAENKTVNTGLTFCGLMMGDHSKCGINTMFNTGTVVGVSCNLYGGDYPKTAIPSFCWGGGDKMYTYDLTKAMNTASRMMARRNKELSQAEMDMYKAVFENTRAKRESFIK